MSALVPNGAMGVLLKSNLPASSLFADLLGVMREKRSMLRVSCTWGRNSSQSCRGQVGSTVDSVEMKCSLNVAIARSAALTRWLCGGTSCRSIFCLWMCLTTALEHSLSMMLRWIVWPRAVNSSWILVKASIMAASVCDGMARTRIALMS